VNDPTSQAGHQGEPPLISAGGVHGGRTGQDWRCRRCRQSRGSRAGPAVRAKARAAVRAKARAAARALPPQRVPELSHLSLAGLRTYRAALSAEEDRVSYWRRILQGRLDVTRTAAEQPTDIVALWSALRPEQVQRGRSTLVRVVPQHDIPPLPDLAALWERCPPSGDEPARQALQADLGLAESALSRYRTSLHQQLEAATGELIARYHAEPDSCLSALPTRTPPDPAAQHA